MSPNYDQNVAHSTACYDVTTVLKCYIYQLSFYSFPTLHTVVCIHIWGQVECLTMWRVPLQLKQWEMFFKSVKIWQSYRQNKLPPCYISHSVIQWRVLCTRRATRSAHHLKFNVLIITAYYDSRAVYNSVRQLKRSLRQQQMQQRQ